jgi:hypothetical protein
MSAVDFILGGWLLLNATVFVALMLRRSRPEVRERLFRWVIDGGRRGRHLDRPKAALRRARKPAMKETHLSGQRSVRRPQRRDA